MVESLSLSGLVAATFTPMNADGTLKLAAVPGMVDQLIEEGIQAFYILGSTGEGNSLTIEERQQGAEAFVSAVAGRIPVIVQVGCESLQQARGLAAHAQSIGASAISAVSPVYFKPDSIEALLDSMATIAGGAPRLPFYYYHIPTVTGVALNMVSFLQQGEERIPTLKGIKFTSMNIPEFQACVEFCQDRMEMLWGVDEMLLSGLVAGAKAAVGSTYNFAGPLYQSLLTAYEQGDMTEANRLQSLSQVMVRTFVPYGPRSSQKAMMSMIGADCGPCRLPIRNLSKPQYDKLREELEECGFFDWRASSGQTTTAAAGH